MDKASWRARSQSANTTITPAIVYCHKKASWQSHGSNRHVCSVASEISVSQNVPCAEDRVIAAICWSFRQTGKHHIRVFIPVYIQYDLIMQVFQRLQKLNICMSHQVTTTLVNTLGTNHDMAVLKWRDSLVESLGRSSEVSYTCMYQHTQMKPFKILGNFPLFRSSSPKHRELREGVATPDYNNS